MRNTVGVRQQTEGIPLIKASLDGQTITITADPDSAATVTRIQGITRTAKMPPLTWHLPFNLDNVAQLRAVKAMASPGLVQAVKDAATSARYVEQMKTATTVEPMRPVPVKPGVTL
jgi:hypothetical protein